MTAKPPWSLNLWHYELDDAELMREILLAAGVPDRVRVTREGDVRRTKGFKLVDPATPHGAKPDWLTSVGHGEGLGDYLRGFIPRYTGRPIVRRS